MIRKFASEASLSSSKARALQIVPSPFLINNSCLSWTGVGQAFVRGSARVFVGTHWPIRNETAARIGVGIIDRLLAGSTAAEALRETIRTTDDRFTALSYVLVGPHDARLDHKSKGLTSGDSGLMYVTLLTILSGRESSKVDPETRASVLEFLESHKGHDRPAIPSEFSGHTKRTVFDIKVQLLNEGVDLDLDQLVEQGREAIATYETDPESLAFRTCSHLGATLMRRGTQHDLIEARVLFSRALEEERQHGMKKEEAKELGNLGVVEMTLREAQVAISLHEQALALNEELGNTKDLILDLQNLAVCHAELDAISQALDYAQRALEAHSTIHDFRPTRLATSR